MDKKEKIIKTAIRLFVSQGFENTPTSQISKEARVATGTLFHHFKTKEDLINAAYLYFKKKMMEETDDAYNDTLVVKERLKRAWFAGFDWTFNNQTLVDFSIKFSASIYISKITASEGRDIFQPFRDIIAAGKKEGIFKNLPESVLEQIFYSIFQSFFTRVRQSKKLDRKMVSKGFDVVWDALKK